MIEKLLEIRKELKDKKPDFIRQDNDRRMRIGRKAKWRKPKGIHSKIRHHFKGRRKMPSPGYKSPVEAKGLHASGLKLINIFSVDDIKVVNKESEGIVISKTVGMKKRFEIFKKAKELQVQVLNLNIDEQLKKIEDFINSKKKPEAKETKKQETKEQKDAKKEPEKTTALTDEQRKEVEKKEKDKILTKKK